MSISDVLFDAEEAIKRYLAKDMITGFVGFSEGTPELKAKVVDFLSTMRKMREELDKPPTPQEVAEWRMRHSPHDSGFEP
jgi:hypothetical protein